MDTVILESEQSLEQAAALSRKDSRVILSRDNNARRLTKLTGPGRVYSVTSLGDARAQKTEIVKYFNLVVSAEDYFSRCSSCNCSMFVKLAADGARAIKHNQESCANNSSGPDEAALTDSGVFGEFKVHERRLSCVGKVIVSTCGVLETGVRLQLDRVKDNKLKLSQVLWGCCDFGRVIKPK